MPAAMMNLDDGVARLDATTDGREDHEPDSGIDDRVNPIAAGAK